MSDELNLLEEMIEEDMEMTAEVEKSINAEGVNDDDIVLEESEEEMGLLNDSHIEDDIVVEESDVDIELLDDSTTDEVDDISEETKDPKLLDSNQNGWKIDLSVPFGWRYKNAGRIFHLQSPAGKVFRSRRAAFESMSVSGIYKSDEIKAMKSTLRHEGWKESENIPRNWMFKKLD